MSHIQHIGAALASLGWNTKELSPYHSATKVYATAVGPKEAHAYVRFASDRPTACLSGEYWSEGRNTLSTCSQAIPLEPIEALEVAVQAFSNEVDRKVADTYAMRLVRPVTPSTNEAGATMKETPTFGATQGPPALDQSPPSSGKSGKS